MDHSDLVILLLGLTLFITIVNMVVTAYNSSSSQLSSLLTQYQDNVRLIREESRNNRLEFGQSQKDQRELISTRLADVNKNQNYLLGTFQEQLHQLIQGNDQRFKQLNDSTQKSLFELRSEIVRSLDTIRQDNAIQLEKMRVTVDDKLHKTLETRLGQSFKMVNDSLDKVQKGLGEMQTLATGVGDLKKVLSNVKTRGILGEIQLGSILEQMLSPEQYALNVATIPSSRNHVEFAIKFPGKDDTIKNIWLPIDSKFPLDRHEAVVNAYDSGNKQELSQAVRALINTVKSMAKDIKNKYIAPPYTTDFGILFLPTEGLYAEVVRHAGLIEEIQRDHRIMLAGPSNLAAFLNSLQMGFQTLAIEKRSSEVWKILGAVKNEFGKFGEVLAKTQKKLQEASNVIDKAGVRSRVIAKKLSNVQELPGSIELN